MSNRDDTEPRMRVIHISMEDTAIPLNDLLLCACASCEHELHRRGYNNLIRVGNRLTIAEPRTGAGSLD